MKRELREGLLRRILPAFLFVGAAMWIARPPDWRALSVAIALALAVGLVLARVLRHRVRAAGLAGSAERGAPVKVVLEVQPIVLLLCIALAAAIGALAGKLGMGGRYGASITVPLVLLAFGLSLRPKRSRKDG